MRRPFVLFGLAAGLYLILAVALTWPLALHMGSRVPNDLGDSLLNMFLLAWNARETPLTPDWWNLPQFYPLPGTLAFSEHLLGLSLLATPVIVATGNVLLAYNIAFLVSFPLCALAAHLLAYELTRRHDLALVAGLAFGFAPYRMAQLAHVQVLSSYWMPLALYALHVFLRRREWRWLLLFAASWYLQALACGYYLFYLSVLVGLWLLWFAAGRTRPSDIGRIVVAWAAAGVAMAPIAFGYLKYQRLYGLRRWPDEIQAFSADIASLLAAPYNLRLWGWLNVVDRPESTLFPGLALVVTIAAGAILAWSVAARGDVAHLRAPRILILVALALAAVAATPVLFGPWRLEPFGIRLLSVGTWRKPLSLAVLLATLALALHPSVRAGWHRRSPLAFYSLAAVVMWVFSLGPEPTFMNERALYKAPYAWLMLVPGVDGVRVPARFWVLATLCLAVAGALALGQITTRWPRLTRAAPVVLAILMLAESWPRPVPLWVPPAARPSHTRAAARLEVPLPGPDLVSLYRAIEHRRPLINGYSGYFAPHYAALQDSVRRSDGIALAYLTSLGPVEVVIDHDRDPDSTWRASIRGLPNAELVHDESAYSAFRLPRTPTTVTLPSLDGDALPIAGVRTALFEEFAPRMHDGDLISRWHTGGPQAPGQEITVDIGAVRTLTGIEMQIGGYVADFPRALVVDTSADGGVWSPAWSGRTAGLAFMAALNFPQVTPIRIPIEPRDARFIRMRQMDTEAIYYWSIAELRLFGR